MTAVARRIRLIMQLRRSGIADTAVLGAIERLPREAFLPAAFHDQAWEDKALPIGEGQTISRPLVVAQMTQALELNDRHKILEIGTGSGYQAAVLAKLCRRVYTIERHRPLLREAEARFAALRLHNITTRHGDGMRGWREQAPFDRIIVTAAAQREIPEALTNQLAIGGIMILPMEAGARAQSVWRVRRTESGLEREELWPTRFVPLLPHAVPEVLPRAGIGP